MASTQISLQLYTIRSLTPTPEAFFAALPRVRAIGYESIQGGRPPGGMPRREYKALLEDIGLSMSCYGGGLEGIAADIGGYIEDCHLFGLDEIMIGSFPAPYRENAETYRAGIAEMNRLGRQLAKEGIRLGYHNHTQEFRRFGRDGKRAIDLIFEETDPEAVNFILDTHWIQAGGGDVIEWMKKCAGRMRYLHVKDYRIAPNNYFTGIGDTVKEWAEIGQGNLPWPLILETGRALGIQSYIVEQDQTYGRDPMESIAISYNYLRGLGLR